MKKILVVCHLVENRFDGQQSKTNDVIDALKKRGFAVEILDYGRLSWFSILSKSSKKIKRNSNILLLPGGKKALFLYVFLSRFFKNKNFYYLAVGGWVTDLIQKKSSRRKLKNLKNFKCVALQNKKSVSIFESFGFKNIIYVPTFSSKKALSVEQFEHSLAEFNKSKTFKFCFFARVEESKGVFEACKVIKKLASEHYDVKFDIYGQIQNKDMGKKLEEYLDDNIQYCGVLHDDAINVLSSYYCMLFPTYYRGEGMAHSIIESFMAGLPVIATDWKFNSELIKENETGFLIKLDDLENNLYKQILYGINNKNKIAEMREKCFSLSNQYDSDNVLKSFIETIERNDNF